MSSIKITTIKNLRPNYKTIVLGLLLAIVWPLATIQAQVLPLDSVLQRIQTQNPMLQEFNYKARAMDAYAEGARSWMAPMVGGGVFMTPYPGAEVMDSRDKGSFMISAEQAIPNPAKQRAKENYMRSRAAIELSGRDFTYNQLRAEAKTAYYQWVVLQQKQSVLRESERIMNFMLKLAKVRYPYNQSTLGSIYKAEARLHEVDNMRLMNENDIEQKQIILNTLMNQPRHEKFMVDTLIRIPEEITIAVDTALLASTRSDLRRLDQTIQSMRLNVQLEQLERKPDFSLRFDHMIPRDKMMPQQFTAMGMVSIPIAPWSSKMYKANTKAMNLELQAMQQERQNILNEAQGMIRGMATEVNVKKRQVQNYKTKILPALQKNYDATMLAYEQNTAELPLLIDAWEALNMAQMEYLNNLEQLYLMVVSYEKELEK